MSDKEARALGAGVTFTVGDQTFMVKPLSIRQLQEVQREALRFYRRQYIQTFADNVDLLEHGRKLLEQKIEEASRWDVEDLPTKATYDVTEAAKNEDLREWLRGRYGDLAQTDGAYAMLVVKAIHSDDIAPEEVERMTGKAVRRINLPYDSWWVSNHIDGMATFVWASIGGTQSGMTLDAVRQWPMEALVEAAKVVEQLTAPAVGNMSSLPQ